MTTAKREQIIASLRDVEYRREFAADVGTGIAFQIRLLREDRGWSQGELAQRTGTGKRQETISQWENPNYGRYSLTTLIELAAAFDVAPIVRFAPFSELINWTVNLNPAGLTPSSFDTEFEALKVSVPPLKEDANADSLAADKAMPVPAVIAFLNSSAHRTDHAHKENEYAKIA